MTDAQSHVSVERGDGLVARFGDAIVLVTEEASHEKGTEEVLQAVEAGASDGAALASRLGTIVVGSGDGVAPPFGVVAPVGEAYVVLLHGAVWAQITGPEGIQTLSGQQAVTWVDHKVEGSLARLTIGSGDRPIEVDPRSDLRAGLVPGSGFVLTPAGSSAVPAAAVKEEPKVVAPEPAVAKSRATVSPSAPLAEPTDAPEPPEPAAPEPAVAKSRATVSPSAPLEAPAAAPEPVAPAPAIVIAAPEPAPVEAAVPPTPSRPTADLSAVVAPAAEALSQLPDPPTPDPPKPDPPKPDPPRPDPPRPDPPKPNPPKPDPPKPPPPAKHETLDVPAAVESVKPQRVAAGATQMVVRPTGALVGADGRRIPLDRAYVLGRSPQDDPGVTSGAATPVTLDDEDNLISRVHSFVSVDSGQVMVRDSSSANGTFIAKPGDQTWTQVGADPVALPPTWSLRVGKTIFTHVADGGAAVAP